MGSPASADHVEHEAAPGRTHHLVIRAFRNRARIGVVAAQTAGQGTPAAAELLVDDRLAQEIAGQPDAGLPEGHGHAELGGEAALHVPASPAVEATAPHDTRPGAVAPRVGARGHRVHVPGQQEAAAASRSREAGDEIVASLVVPVSAHIRMARTLEEPAVVHLHVEAVGLEEGAEGLLGSRLVSVGRHRDAVHAHEGLDEANDLGLHRAKEAAGVADGIGRAGHGEGPRK